MVMKDPMTNKSRGFGFLTFVDPKNVDAVLKEDHHLDGKMVRLSDLTACLLYPSFLKDLFTHPRLDFIVRSTRNVPFLARSKKRQKRSL